MEIFEKQHVVRIHFPKTFGRATFNNEASLVSPESICPNTANTHTFPLQKLLLTPSLRLLEVRIHL